MLDYSESDNGILYFTLIQGDSALAGGITTRDMGDYGNFKKISNHRKRIKKVSYFLDFVDADHAVFLIPTHCGEAVKKESGPRGSTIHFWRADDFFLSPSAGRLLGIVHCSWLTLLKYGIVERALTRIQNKTGIAPTDLKGVIYSGICQECYEVDEAVAAPYRVRYPDFFKVNGHPGRYNLDLAGIIQEKASRKGVEAPIVQCCPHHGKPHSSNGYPLYSFRRGDAGRNFVFIHSDNKLLAGQTGDCPYLILWKK